MKNLYKSFLTFTVVTIFSFIIFSQLSTNEKEEIKFEKVRSSSSPKASFKMKKARGDYFFNMLRDPAINKIPEKIRQSELRFAKILSQKNSTLGKTSALTWSEAGPSDVGGRTRALAVDVNDPNTIIAGGASGGIWKSTDKGATWTLKSISSTILSVSSIAQDPRSGFTNTWYYSGGEDNHNLAGTIGSRFSGDGIYKSTDNGETWNVLASTHSPNTTQWDSDFDYILKIVVSPVNGNIFVANNGTGIFKSTDGGNSFTKVLGDLGHHIYSDVSVGSDGTILAVLSGPFQGYTPTKTPGLYKSVDNGAAWTNISLAGYPATAMRSVITIAPSNPNVAYLLTNTGETADNKEVNKFYKINVGSSTSEDRSGNIPDFSNVAPQTGAFSTQNGYDMIVAVKPDDENFVLIGGTILLRSSDGFATKPSDHIQSFIGGYYPINFIAQYPNFHPDVHSFSFDPTNPNAIWWGHDGGLSYTTDITNSSYQEVFPWQKMNNGYNVTQFYHISISKNSGDNRIMGGTQDNGTPFFNFTGTVTNQIMDVTTGDGSFSYFGADFSYTGVQNGVVIRNKYDQQNYPDGNAWSEVTPSGATNQFFINPFEVDPNDENIMYYPAGNVLWRNNQLGSIPDGQQGTTTGWTKLDNMTVPSGYGIYALAISKSPAHILYYAAWNPQGAPKVFKLANANTATSGAVEISIPEAPSGSYIHNIAINPDNADEILVVLSNYNIIGLYHSTNGGELYTAVEGNLEGTEQNPGPSLRAATILPGNGYYLATSIGVFSASQLNGGSTNWVQEGQNIMGNVIVSHITSRKSDGRIVAGTHGRGAFVASGTGGGGGDAVLSLDRNELNIDVYPELTRSSSFRISNPGGASLSFSVSATGGGVNIKETVSNLSRSKFNSSANKNSNNKEMYFSKPGEILAEEELILDDGNALPSGFFGMATTGYQFYWANEFKLDKDFALKRIRFYMKTESATSNSVGIEVQSGNGTILYTTTANTDLSANGQWYEFDFPQDALSDLTFQNGDTFYLIVASLNTAITLPAGYDDNGLKTGQSYWAYYDPSFSYWSGYSALTGTAAWLVRAVGDTEGGGGTNQSPVANAQVSPNPADVNQAVNFNGSGSSDPDGQITSYFWEFGDGQTSTQSNTTHAYSQAGQYTYGLTVTDNNGATNKATGQITINGGGGGTNRFTISPSSGSVAAGGFQDILVTYNSQGLSEGSYQGQINITSSAGNTVIPVNIFVSTTVDADDEKNIIYSYKLEQNYPNPFNPSTTIRWHLAEPGNVSLKVYDIKGEEIATLIDEFKNSGSYETVFDANSIKKSYTLTSGVYVYRLESGNYTDTKKLVLIK